MRVRNLCIFTVLFMVVSHLVSWGSVNIVFIYTIMGYFVSCLVAHLGKIWLSLHLSILRLSMHVYLWVPYIFQRLWQNKSILNNILHWIPDRRPASCSFLFLLCWVLMAHCSRRLKSTTVSLFVYPLLKRRLRVLSWKPEIGNYVIWLNTNFIFLIQCKNPLQSTDFSISEPWRIWYIYDNQLNVSVLWFSAVFL